MEEGNQNLITEEPLVRQMEGTQEGKKKPILMILLAVLVIFLGAGSGYLLVMTVGTPKSSRTRTTLPGGKSKVKKGETFGVDNPEVYRDQATGVLKQNDKSFTDEGSHVLIRDENNPSQNAYLTSTVLDLNLFVDREVEVWGETFAAQKAGWLMDVGKVKVLK